MYIQCMQRMCTVKYAGPGISFFYYVNKDKFLPKHIKPAAPKFDHNTLNIMFHN